MTPIPPKVKQWYPVVAHCPSRRVDVSIDDWRKRTGVVVGVGCAHWYARLPERTHSLDGRPQGAASL